MKELIAKIASDQIVCVKPIDFWRYALDRQYRIYLTDPKYKQSRDAKKWFQDCMDSHEISQMSFIDVKQWSWCLKYDGFYVRLKLDSTNTWKIYSRNGIEYNPPTSFLKHLTIKFPKGVEIEAELVYDTDQRCLEVDRADEKKRIVKRTKDFDKLHVSALRSKKDMSAWNGLRLVLFSFVWKDETFQDSFKMGAQRIEQSQHLHPHITICSYKKVVSTADAIEIFKSVVQMGLEGIIVRKNTAKYSNEPVSSDTTSTIFKMKPKIVTAQEQKFKFKSVVKKAREGGVRAEVEYEVPNFQIAFPPNCIFTDSRDPGALDPNHFYSKRLKWHEQAPSKMNVWDLNNLGMRHVCFATDLDLSFQVQPKEHPDKEEIVNQMLIQTQPFSFIVETVYLVLDMFVYKPSVMEEGMVVMGQKTMIKIGNKHVLDIGILKLAGKTDEVVKAQTYIHKKYIRNHIQEKQHELGPTEELFETLMLLLQHIPYDNKKFVFVVNNQHVLKDFKSLGKKIIDLKDVELGKLRKIETFESKEAENKIKESIAKKEIEIGFFTGMINRLQKNEKARRQQVDVVFMQPYRQDKKGIPFPNYISGQVTSKAQDPNSFCALLSRDLEESEFMTLSEQQFNLYLELQKLWNFIGDPVKRQNAAKICRLNELPEPFEENIIYLDLVFDMKAIIGLKVNKKDKKTHEAQKEARQEFYTKLDECGVNYQQQLAYLYHKLEKYSKDHNKNRLITLRDFQDIFHPAYEIEKSCPNDPATGKFPYRTEPGSTGINQWHRAWHMSYAFFKSKDLSVDWTVPVVPVPEKNSSTQQQDVVMQSRDPVPSPPREQQPSSSSSRDPVPLRPREQQPSTSKSKDSVPSRPPEQQPSSSTSRDPVPSGSSSSSKKRPSSSHIQSSGNTHVVDMTDSPPTSPPRSSRPQKDNNTIVVDDSPPASPPRSSRPQKDNNTIVIHDSPPASPPQASQKDPKKPRIDLQDENPDEMETEDERSPILSYRSSTKKAYDEMETDNERSPILSYKPSTKKISYEMETDDEVDETKDSAQAPEEDEGEEMYPQEEDEGDEMYPQEEDEADENADASKEPEEEERDLTHAKAWLKAQMEADAEAEKKRLRDEKYKGRHATLKEYFEDWEEDKKWEEEKNKRSQKLHISALLHQLKIYAME